MMNESKGYIKLYRSLLENPVICRDSEHIAIWIYLLLNATHKGHSVMFDGKRVDLLPGQLITGRRSMAKTLKISDSKVQRVLKLFEIEHQIEQQTTTRNRLVSVVNWDSYQSSEPPNAHKRTTSEHKQECKNEKNDINSGLFDRFWKIYPVKNGKATALKSFNKLAPDPKLFDQIMAAVESQQSEKTRLREMKQFCPAWPHPSTWLNNKRWEDETGDQTEDNQPGQIYMEVT